MTERPPTADRQPTKAEWAMKVVRAVDSGE